MKSVKIIWVFMGIILSTFVFMGCLNNNPQNDSEATEEIEDANETENEDGEELDEDEIRLDSLESEAIDSSEYDNQ